MSWVDDLRTAGWTVEVAFGDAAPERARLDELQAVATMAPTVPELEPIVEKLRAVHLANPTNANAERLGALLYAIHEVTKVVEGIAAAQDAVTHAESVPTVYHVSADGVSLYVSDTDADTITSLLAVPPAANTAAVHAIVRSTTP